MPLMSCFRVGVYLLKIMFKVVILTQSAVMSLNNYSKSEKKLNINPLKHNHDCFNQERSTVQISQQKVQCSHIALFIRMKICQFFLTFLRNEMPSSIK